MAHTKKHTSRDEWRKRIERWQESGLTAEQFAAEVGINAGTLKYWKYRLSSSAKASAAKSAFVEVPMAVAASTSPACFELEIGAKVRLRVPAAFDGAALGRLLDVLERR